MSLLAVVAVKCVPLVLALSLVKFRPFNEAEAPQLPMSWLGEVPRIQATLLLVSVPVKVAYPPVVVGLDSVKKLRLELRGEPVAWLTRSPWAAPVLPAAGRVQPQEVVSVAGA